MQIDLHVIINTPSKTKGSTSVVGTNSGIIFKAPGSLIEAGFPSNSNVNFNVDTNSTNPLASNLYSKNLSDIGSQFGLSRGARNTIVYAYGQQGTPKRREMFSVGGYAEKVLQDAFKNKPSGATYRVNCFIMSSAENLVDCINHENNQGLVVESVKEGPRVKHIDQVTLNAASDITEIIQKISKKVETHFASVDIDYYSSEEIALRPYNPDTVILSLFRFNDKNVIDSNVENNSIHFVALGDCDRPPLCGINLAQMQIYEKNQKILSSVVGVLQAIRNSRLRIPYGKSTLTLLLKRAYNGERNNPNNTINKPTKSIFFVHLFNDDVHAEEAFHTLTMTRRLSGLLNAIGFGPATRDLAAEKWRLEQDIMELKDELNIAKQVYEYKPCIFDQPKPVQNISEEVNKRINAILKKREEIKEKQLAEVKEKAKEEANQQIEREERKTGVTIASLEKAAENKKRENEAILGESTRKVKEYEKHLEKLRKKKDEEEVALVTLKNEVKNLEEELANRKSALEKKKRQVEMASSDQAKGLEAIMKEHEEVKSQRDKLLEERRKQREQWIIQIRETNEKVLAQVQLLTLERRKRQQKEGVVSSEDDAGQTEEQVREDIESIDRYLPKLISLEDNPADIEATESIRRQLEDYFLQERETYLKKLEEEKERKEKLEKAVEEFRVKLQESQTKVYKNQITEAMKKEQHLQMLFDQVLQYLTNGLRMSKINKQGDIKRKFFFLGEDQKRIHACDLDSVGLPISRKKPSVTILLKDIKQIVLGCYTPVFVSYSGEFNLSKKRKEAMRNDGSYNPEPTQILTPENIGLYNYRSFALLLPWSNTMEVVCDSDSDYEAWILVFKRLLNYKTALEVENERKAKRREGLPYEPPVNTATITWGASLDIKNYEGADQLTSEEATLCREQHIPPVLFLRIKAECIEKSQFNIITVYDIRVAYALDLIRSQAIYEHFININLFPVPSFSSSKCGAVLSPS